MSERPEGTTAEPTPRWFAWLPSNLAGGIYGSVLAASVAVGASGHDGTALAVILVVTGFVFWVAHVYAETAASVHGGWQVGAIRRGMRHEWPLMGAALPPALAVLMAKLLPGDVPADGAWVACLVAIAQQQLFGLAAVRGADLTRRQRTRSILLNLAIGLMIILLKVLVH